MVHATSLFRGPSLVSSLGTGPFVYLTTLSQSVAPITVDPAKAWAEKRKQTTVSVVSRMRASIGIAYTLLPNQSQRLGQLPRSLGFIALGIVLVMRISPLD